ncbi:UDP-glucose 4-epimerase GalE [Frigoribacterium faeni]|uniref:UDP-glucose 4-epimerase n=1 Tax=Frigoribacterium faeni TaxID=145483 RepID=A0A7W3JJN6_9MICO|nr:UDP-glucose 4-epimerase GalE [Frigoribacterium faeni]MBA8814088.1 UDP-glucose 4-epimerase [Frigoribacterium faeni]BFF16118.1 UDP-glucose 4-epimerase GalE [Microbacterium flavescens]GEK82680.1 UDP-glucose 4-epimerase GalE [Frigoribacterium faeni]
MTVLITGGAGFIGSTVASACADRGHEVVVLDDLSTGTPVFAARHRFYRGDIADADLIDRIVRENPDITTVVHCAARIVVPESVADPFGYFDSNVARTVSLLQGLARNGIDRVVFSSSAAIYDTPADGVVAEGSPLAPPSPYADTKAVIERVLAAGAGAGLLRAVALRYFNPIGADPRLRTGLQVPTPSHALGKLISAWRADEPFVVTGTDWPTRDGSGVRDYVHVWDLAEAHALVVDRFDDVVDEREPFRAVNLGTGQGTTVLELVEAFGRVAGGLPRVEIGAARAGDTAGAFADVSLARELLGWEARLTVDEGIADSLRWSDLARRQGLFAPAPSP